MSGVAYPDNGTVTKGRALDYGCGVGRLTQALARHFDLVEGVDIAPSMIELANKFNRYAGRCHYHVNFAKDLSLFDDEFFDFIYSSFVLQHIKPEYSRNYIEEFLKLLALKGVPIFTMPNEASTFRGKLLATTYPLIDAAAQLYHTFYRAVRKNPRMRLYVIKRREVEVILRHSSAKVIDVTTMIWQSLVYLVSCKQRFQISLLRSKKR